LDLAEHDSAQIAFGMTQCDILKISDNEIQWFTGEEDFDAGIMMICGTLMAISAMGACMIVASKKLNF
jgi:hypothetical protein